MQVYDYAPSLIRVRSDGSVDSDGSDMIEVLEDRPRFESDARFKKPLASEPHRYPLLPQTDIDMIRQWMSAAAQ